MAGYCWFGVGYCDYDCAGVVMLKVAAYILHGVGAFLLGCLAAVWFAGGGYGGIAWFAFVLGVVFYFALVAVVALMWLAIVGDEVRKGD